MEKPHNNFLSKFLLTLNLIIMIIFFIFDKQIRDSFEWIFLVGFAFAISMIFYVSLKEKYQLNVKKMKIKLNYHLGEISKNKKIDLSTIIYDDDLIGFYQNLDKINLWLDEKEKSYESILYIINSVVLNNDLEKMLDTILPKILEYTISNCGAFYLVNNSNNRLEIKCSLGFSKNIYNEFDISIGEGFMGASIKDNTIKIIKNIPDDTIYLTRTFLGKIKPKNIMIIPISDNENIVGMIVLSSVFNYTQLHVDMLNIVRTYFGVAVNNALTFERTKRLTNELRFQNRLIQDLNDDLEKKVDDRTLFLNSIIDSIEDYAIFATDKEYKITAWNSGAENIFGYSKEEVKGKDINVLYENDTREVKQKLEYITSKGKVREQGWQKKKDGTMYYSDSSYFRMDDNQGNIIGFTSVTRDITSLRNAEDALWIERGLTQKILDSSMRSIIVTDLQGYIELFNNNVSILLNEKDLRNKNICSFFNNGNTLREYFNSPSEDNVYQEMHFSLLDSKHQVKIKLSNLTDQNNQTVKMLIFFVKL